MKQNNIILLKAFQLKNKFYDILLKYGFSKEDAELCSEIFTENTLSGVDSHGVNRFHHFIDLVKRGYIKVDSKPTLINKFNGFEQWDGNFGPGPVNAWNITQKVIELAREFGISCITLKNTNHWMRAGTYGWRAVKEEVVFICWTNSVPNLPPWGAVTPAAGNNPIVFAIPRKNGPVVLDMALSQFSYGKLATYRREGENLPLPGGFDEKNNLTNDPEKIYQSQRPLPIGYWKGSGLSLLLDLIVTILSGGKSTSELSISEIDSGMSQIFIAIDPLKFASTEQIYDAVDRIIDYYKSAETMEGYEIIYPGERALKTKKERQKKGIPVNREIWNKITTLL